MDIGAFVGVLLLVYKLNQLPTGVITTDIIGRVTIRYQNLFNQKPPFSFSAIQQILGSWDSDLNYRKMVAGFLEEYPTNKWSKLRFGTLYEEIARP